VDHLRSKGVRVLSGPIALDEGPCAGLRADHFLDPWRNCLELIEYGELRFMAKTAGKIYRA
jgi:hypothetical protein